MTHCTYPSPVGDLYLAADGGGLVALRFRAPEADGATPPADGQPVLDAARRQLDAYFAGRRRAFDLPLAPPGTAFQRGVWAELQRIRFGQTISYRELAERVGRPGASRAVGSANGANPIAIVIPCHRVIAADGSLAGFAGGVAVKRALLDHELAYAGLFAAAPASG